MHKWLPNFGYQIWFCTRLLKIHSTFFMPIFHSSSRDWLRCPSRRATEKEEEAFKEARTGWTECGDTSLHEECPNQGEGSPGWTVWWLTQCACGWQALRSSLCGKLWWHRSESSLAQVMVCCLRAKKMTDHQQILWSAWEIDYTGLFG